MSCLALQSCSPVCFALKRLCSPDPEVAAFLESVAVDVMDKHANDADFPERMRDKARELLLK